MKNPLNKRFVRELKSDLGRYIVLFVFIVAMIAIVSGFQVAGNSMIKAYDESFEKYNIEDGNFELTTKADEGLIEKIEENDVTIYENFYLEEETTLDTTIRIFKNREDVNRACLMSGEFPVADNEIAIDRIHANKNELEIGDTITVSGKELKISGLVALTDYSALYQSPTDTMFDTKMFGVGVMTEEGFETIGDDKLHFSYSWRYEERPVDDVEAKEMSDDLMEELLQLTKLDEYIPAYSNQAIQFTGNDMGRDSAMFVVFLYLMVAILAFIFAITTTNTIAKESAVIGTLRASGYSKGELIRHYLAMPMLVTFVAAVIGNILGYTVMENFAADLYYNSYCLTTYEIIWNAKAFVNTTIVPLVIMFLINYFILVNKFKLSPLMFIRRDLKKSKKKKTLRLSTKIDIMKRFRLRIILQNMPNYITIIMGVFFANVIMVFGVSFPALLNNHSEKLADNMISKYQYVLKAPADTENESAEPYTAYSLKTMETKGFSEQVSLYGVEKDSQYVDVDFDTNRVYISSGYSDKYDVHIGDTITLKDEFEDTEYTFKVDGIYDYSIGIAVFLEREALNNYFDLEEGYYNCYFADEKIIDIDEKLIATVISEDDMNKVSRQLMDSLGGMMDIFFYIGVIIFMLVIYLLSKIIVEKNAQSISMIKILGYSHSEINGLYVITTAIVVIASLILTMPVVDILMKIIVEYMFFMYSGWMNYYVPLSSFAYISIAGILAYGVIAFFQMRKVKQIPMEDALKNVE
ncbi:MAG: ABC transporter permease [Lachnospiraceae bacterium]|nr:ABC transporter permease [Lachnospiraceae bacterium]